MVIKHSHKNNFLILPYARIRDENLTLKDVGLLCYMLSMSNDWVFSVNGLNSILPNDGKAAITSSLTRLEQAGYLRRTPVRKDGRLAGNLWQISDTPIFSPYLENQDTVNSSLSKKQTKINTNNKAKTVGAQFSPPKNKPSPKWIETGIDEDGLSIGYWEGLEDWRDLC